MSCACGCASWLPGKAKTRPKKFFGRRKSLPAGNSGNERLRHSSSRPQPVPLPSVPMASPATAPSRVAAVSAPRGSRWRTKRTTRRASTFQARSDGGSENVPKPKSIPSRRDTLLATALLACAPVFPALAADTFITEIAPGFASSAPKITEQVFFDLAVDGEFVGKVIVGVYGEVRIWAFPKSWHTACPYSYQKGALPLPIVSRVITHEATSRKTDTFLSRKGQQNRERAVSGARERHPGFGVQAQ